MTPVCLFMAIPVQADLGRLGPVVGGGQLGEPRVVEGLLGGDALRGVVHEDPLEKVAEVLEERVAGREDVLQGSALPPSRAATDSGTHLEPLHGVDEPARPPRRVGGGVVQLQPFEVPTRAISRAGRTGQALQTYRGALDELLLCSLFAF